MALTGTPRTPRPARKARPKTSLKMQAIGFLSRREHSRQELRTKLLASLRKRAREEAELAAAGERAAREIAAALRATPSNGIDDAFAPPVPVPEMTAAAPTRTPARVPVAQEPSNTSLIDHIRLANGEAPAGALRAAIEAGAAVVDADPSAKSVAGAIAGATDFEVDSGDDADARDVEAIVDQLLDWLTANKYLSEQRFVESRVNARSRKQGAMMIKHELSRHGLVLEPEQAAALRETEFERAQALWRRKFGEVGADARARAKQARFLASRGFASDVVRRIVGGEEEF